MLDRILLLFKKDEVVAELKKGAMAPGRARDFLITGLAVSTVGNLINAVAGLLRDKKDGAGMETFIGVFVMLIVILAMFALVRYLINNLFEANGGHNGRLFYERLFLLLLSAGLRIGVVMIAILLVLLVPFLALGSALHLAVLVAIPLLMFAVLIAGFAFTYREMKEGFIRIRGAENP